MSGGGRTLSWTAENQPKSITSVSGTESYTYDGERLTRTAGGVTTVYASGRMEWDLPSSANNSRRFYTFAGQTVAQRTLSGTANTLYYLHGDHLGSIGVVSIDNGGTPLVVGTQEYLPWGETRSSTRLSPNSMPRRPLSPQRPPVAGKSCFSKTHQPNCTADRIW